MYLFVKVCFWIWLWWHNVWYKVKNKKVISWKKKAWGNNSLSKLIVTNQKDGIGTWGYFGRVKKGNDQTAITIHFASIYEWVVRLRLIKQVVLAVSWEKRTLGSEIHMIHKELWDNRQILKTDNIEHICLKQTHPDQIF